MKTDQRLVLQLIPMNGHHVFTIIVINKISEKCVHQHCTLTIELLPALLTNYTVSCIQNANVNVPITDVYI